MKNFSTAETARLVEICTAIKEYEQSARFIASLQLAKTRCSCTIRTIFVQRTKYKNQKRHRPLFENCKNPNVLVLQANIYAKTDDLKRKKSF